MDYIEIEIEKIAAKLNLNKKDALRQAVNLMRQAIEADEIKMIKEGREVVVRIN